jgi:hypothetical protein
LAGARNEHGRFAGACSGKNQQRTMHVKHGLALFGIESGCPVDQEKI